MAAGDARNVEYVGHIGGASYAVAAQGHYAYIGEGPSLIVLDVSNPASPTVVGKAPPLPGIVRGVAVAGSYAYVAVVAPVSQYLGGGSLEIGGSLRVLDVSTPANPKEVGFYDTPGAAYGVAVAGSYAYVAGGYSGGLRVMDVSSPAWPTEVGSCDTPGEARGVAVAGSYAYVADGVYGGLRVMDVSDPANPTEVGSFVAPGDVRGVAVGASGYVYVAAGDYRGLRVMDVSAPSNPTVAGFFDTPGYAYGVAVAGSYAYVADGHGGLRVVNVSTPSNPMEVGLYDTPQGAWDVSVAGDYAYVAETPVWDGSQYVGGGLRVVDVSTPAKPTEVGFCDTPGSALAVAIAGDRAYVADGSAGLRVVDVSDPTSPMEVGFCQVWSPLVVAVAGRFAYLGNEDVLWVIDISNPANPWAVDYVSVPGTFAAYDVAILGGYAYVANSRGSLKVVDISSAGDPREVGSYTTPAGAYAVAIAGNYAYVAGGFPAHYPNSRASYLVVVDVSTPASPTEVALTNTPGWPESVAVAGNYIYVAEGEGGLLILCLLRDKTVGSISPDGANLSSTSGDTSLVFPSGAFTETVLLTYRHLSSDQNTGALVGIGHTFDVTAVYSDTGQPAQLAPSQTYTVTVEYTDAEKGPAIEDTLGLYWWDGGAWSQQGITDTVSVTDNLVVAQVDHLSLFAVLGETKRGFLPMVFRNY